MDIKDEVGIFKDVHPESQREAAWIQMGDNTSQLLVVTATGCGKMFMFIEFVFFFYKKQYKTIP